MRTSCKSRKEKLQNEHLLAIRYNQERPSKNSHDYHVISQTGLSFFCIDIFCYFDNFSSAKTRAERPAQVKETPLSPATSSVSKPFVVGRVLCSPFVRGDCVLTSAPQFLSGFEAEAVHNSYHAKRDAPAKQQLAGLARYSFVDLSGSFFAHLQIGGTSNHPSMCLFAPRTRALQRPTETNGPSILYKPLGE